MLKPIASEVNGLVEQLGLRLTERVAQDGSVDNAQREMWQHQRNSAAQVGNDMVITAVYLLENEKLLCSAMVKNQ